VLGVIPYINDHGVAQEDSADLEHYTGYSTSKFDIAIIALPHISNFDEYDAFKWIPDIHLRYVNKSELLGNPKAIIIPGSKNTIEDMQWLNISGLKDRILECAASHCSVVGLCGGYQMLGEQIFDPYHVESTKGEIRGLGLLKNKTIFNKNKTVTLTKGKIISDKGFWKKLQGNTVEGYEIHLGSTEAENPLIEITHRNYESCKAFDGSSNENGQIFGTYLHGLFENDSVRTAWLNELGLPGNYF
jgi:adenosylcobyric acid synthase